jgi:hypothetical protein
MRFGVSTVLVAACLIGVCGRNSLAINPSDAATVDNSAGGAMVVQLKSKDGTAFEIHVPPPNGKPQDVTRAKAGWFVSIIRRSR